MYNLFKKKSKPTPQSQDLSAPEAIKILDKLNHGGHKLGYLNVQYDYFGQHHDRLYYSINNARVFICLPSYGEGYMHVIDEVKSADELLIKLNALIATKESE